MNNKVLFALSVLISLNPMKSAADISYLETNQWINFDGCEWDKIINLKNGYAWECREYGYTYHYGDMTVLEVNNTTKLCVGDVEEAIEEFPDGDCYDGKLYRW